MLTLSKFKEDVISPILKDTLPVQSAFGRLFFCFTLGSFSIVKVHNKIILHRSTR